MGSYISFKPQDATLPTYVRFVVTTTGFNSISNSEQETMNVLTRLSTSRVLMAVKGKKNGQIDFFTAEGIFSCALSEKNELLLTGFYKNNLIKQNRAMKYGVCFHVSDGIIIQIKLQRYGHFFDIVNGNRFTDNAYQYITDASSVKMIMEQVSRVEAEPETEASEEEASEEEAYKPEKKLTDLLQLAESYSILSSELEEQKARNQGNVAYTGISSISFDRIDRTAYRFGVENLDENEFKTGVQVEIEDKNQVRHAAEIISLVKADTDAPATAVDLMFNDQISIQDLLAEGWFSLSFSTVNKDVQLAANERIKTGEAQAKYMDAVFGRHQSAGFDDKDLTAFKRELQAENPPPNDSQMEAICSGINAKDVFLVMGPPGTGKTTVILSWVKYFVQHEHKRVLVSSQNNKAVDNVLAKFAQDQDIDIIRIGSEAKLQSEVIPFMFENKVAALRRAISEDSQNKRGEVDRIMDQWRPFSEQLGNAIAAKEQQEMRYRLFADRVQEKLRPICSELLHWREKHRQYLDDRHACAEEIRKLAAKLLRHEEASNFLMRFFTGFGYQSKREKMRGLITRLDELNSEIAGICGQYRRCRLRFEACCREVRDTVYRNYEDAGADLMRQFQAIPEKPPVSQEDIWDLFAEARAFVMNTPEDCEGQSRAIAQSMDRANGLKEVLAQWRTDMESKQNYALNEIILESVDLVGATCIGINSQKRFANLDFDVTIIDEAGQIQVHNALVPMSVSNKLIMLGDHKQIPPNVDPKLLELCEENGVRTDLLEMSLFEKMYRDLPDSNKTMLNTQYRMPAEIADTISEWFYSGEYDSPDFKRNRKGLIPALSDKPFVIIDTSGEKDRYETKIEEQRSYYNALEASVVAELIQYLAEDPEYDLKQVGVISAYKPQVNLIKKKVSRFLGKELVREMAATLDSYQGQERDIIVYSFTKSSDISPYRQRIGFLYELRRLNVAMTRCKKTLILVGDMTFLSGCKYCPKDENGVRMEARSEYEFSKFIRKMLSDVRGGRGELISCRQFRERLKGARTQ